MHRFVLAASAAVLLAAPALQLHAQAFATSPCQSEERTSFGLFGSSAHVCEVRTVTLPLVDGHLALSGKNGSIDVLGEDRSDIQLQAQVDAQAPSRDEAQALQRKIEILTQGEIHADGPDPSVLSHRGWSVSYRLLVPRHLAAKLHTVNGSLKLTELDGAITAETTNGSITLRDLAGDIDAHTVNGSLKVSLQGSHWKGSGLSARTTNGSVSVAASPDYSAHLVAQTTNGGVHVGLPVTSPGNLGRHIDTTLGQGGATLNFATTNGSLRIDRN